MEEGKAAAAPGKAERMKRKTRSQGPEEPPAPADVAENAEDGAELEGKGPAATEGAAAPEGRILR